MAVSDEKSILSKLGKFSDPDKEHILEAYNFVKKAHQGHKRYSGEPYLSHLAAVAVSLAEMGMGVHTIIAGLLHDTIEDTEVNSEEIKEKFGEEILFLVEGVTKLGSVRYYGSDRHNESLRKLFVATSQDIRVVIIKLTDRLHNMQTLEHVPTEKQCRIATETLEIYVPIAHRLGMGRIRKELEDLAFPYVHPEEHKRVQSIFKPLLKNGNIFLEKSRKKLQKKLAESPVTNFHTFSRVKGIYSLYQKLTRRDWDIENIKDLFAVRVVVPEIEDCYQVLGIIHQLWKPIPKRMKDYIAFPKPNGYQSIHTTVITSDSRILEIQIRTKEMHQEAEFGITSHFQYKERQSGIKQSLEQKKAWHSGLIPALFKPFSWRTQSETQEQNDLNLDEMNEKPHKEKIPHWINEIAETNELNQTDGDFINDLRKDFFSYRIFVFTPDGDVVDLPVGATPIDFAYTIHSEIGNHASGAKINSKLVHLDSELKNGDIVDIITKNSSKPTPKWLDFVKTSLAQRCIKTSLSEESIT